MSPSDILNDKAKNIFFNKFHNTIEFYEFLNYAIDINNIELVKYIINNRIPIKITIKEITQGYGYIKPDHKWIQKEENTIFKLFRYNKEAYNMFVKACANKYVIPLCKEMVENINMIEPFLDCNYEQEDICRYCYNKYNNACGCRQITYSYESTTPNTTYRKILMTEIYEIISSSTVIYMNEYLDTKLGNIYNTQEAYRDKFYDNIYNLLLKMDTTYGNEWVEFLNEKCISNAYYEALESRVTSFFTNFGRMKYRHKKINEYISKRLFDGTYKVSRMYNNGLANITKMKTEYCIKYYKPECCFSLQCIFDWYCYVNSKYIYKIVKLYKYLTLPTIDTFHRVFYNVNDYYNDEIDRTYIMIEKYNRIKKKMINLGAHGQECQ